MTKTLLLLILFSFVRASANCQAMNFGVKTDLNLFRLTGDGMSREFRPAASAGFFSDIKLGGNWSVQPELLYTQRNTRSRDFSKFFSNSVNPGASTDIFLSYFSLPFLVKYKISPQLAVYAGLQYSYLLYADEDLLKENKKPFKTNDLGPLAGLEYGVSKRLTFYGRFYYGINDINAINDLHHWNAQQIQIGAAFRLFNFR